MALDLAYRILYLGINRAKLAPARAILAQPVRDRYVDLIGWEQLMSTPAVEVIAAGASIALKLGDGRPAGLAEWQLSPR